MHQYQRQSLTSDAFDRGARNYDLMVSLNPGYHRELQRAADALGERLGRGPKSVLDLACGSGASTRALARAVPYGSRIKGIDASAGMIEEAKAKCWSDGVSFDLGVAGNLDLDKHKDFDGILSCYLFRNVAEDARDEAVREAFNMLKPGGWLVVQEYSVAGDPRASRVWDAVSLGIIIPLGVLLDRNLGLYKYLRRSVHEFDTVDHFASRLTGAGFTDVAHRTAHGWQRGILHTFIARRPDPEDS